MKMEETQVDQNEDVITSQLSSWSWMKATIGFKLVFFFIAYFVSLNFSSLMVMFVKVYIINVLFLNCRRSLD
jgi:hypothetical protein